MPSAPAGRGLGNQGVVPALGRFAGRCRAHDLPSARWLGPFELLYFTAIVNLYGLWRWMCGRPRPAEIIHATCGTYFGADVTSVHFLNCVWAATQLRIGFSGWRDVARYPFTLLGMCVERLQWWSPALRLALTVSDSVGAEVRTRTRAKVKGDAAEQLR